LSCCAPVPRVLEKVPLSRGKQATKREIVQVGTQVVRRPLLPEPQKKKKGGQREKGKTVPRSRWSVKRERVVGFPAEKGKGLRVQKDVIWTVEQMPTQGKPEVRGVMQPKGGTLWGKATKFSSHRIAIDKKGKTGTHRGGTHVPHGKKNTARTRFWGTSGHRKGVLIIRNKTGDSGNSGEPEGLPKRGISKNAKKKAKFFTAARVKPGKRDKKR